MSETEAVQERALSGYEAQIAEDVIPWLKENNLTAVEVTCRGCGDEGYADDMTLYRGEEVATEDIEGEEEIRDVLESVASDAANWDWINGSGGEVTITVNVDGRYQVDGGYYSEELTSCDTIYGAVGDVAPDEPPPVTGESPVSLILRRAEIASLLSMLALTRATAKNEGLTATDKLDALENKLRTYLS
jgi:hypothetical protein